MCLLLHTWCSIIACKHSAYHFAFFIHLHSDKLTWLEQITSQVNDCISRLSYIRHRYSFKESFMKSEMMTNSLNEELDETIERITSTYLNFELFRREQKYYTKVANPMLAQEALQCLSCLFYCYYFNSRQSSNNSSSKVFYWISSTCVVMAANFYLTLGALLTSRMDKLIKRAEILVAISIQISPLAKQSAYGFNYAIDLWRRLLTSELDSKKLLAPNIFGMHLSHGKLVNLNICLVTLWFLLARVKLFLN